MSDKLVFEGISRGVFSEVMRTKAWEGGYDSKLSQTTYVIDPDTNELWDIKIVAEVAGKIAKSPMRKGFQTHEAEDVAKNLGFPYLKFRDRKSRELGVRGFDPEELYDAHEVFYPDGTSRRFENGEHADFAINAVGDEETPSFKERRVARLHTAWERRGVNTRKVKEIRGLTCEGCGLNAEVHFGRKIALSCIEAHHLKPVAEMPVEGRHADPDDFAVLCATCHRIIHRLESPDDLEGLRAVVKGVRDLHTLFSKNKSG
ncbi:hypothetical protein HCZ23_10860 [Celeribacter sp. HF31]|uniref:HNH endonuclease n=1 Tax=Celeribacter sp. HF31 TaxID=2721558 RepID=UPI00142F6B85|nr:HNH endonuclease [Celeribacter sp. HF31]NIY79965.1 hypothetical protein [Celeribacter sp. HF31]